MVFQVEDARETRAGELRFVPASVGILIRSEPRDGALYSGIIHTSHRKQTDQAPSRLRSGALPLPLQRSIIVRRRCLAKSAVRILHGPQPFDCALAIFAARDAKTFKRTENAAGA